MSDQELNGKTKLALDEFGRILERNSDRIEAAIRDTLIPAMGRVDSRVHLLTVLVLGLLLAFVIIRDTNANISAAGVTVSTKERHTDE